MFDLEQAIKDRHSTRMFLPQPVPADVLKACLELAQLAPSNSNIQPWRLFIAEGARRDRLKDSLLAEAAQRAPGVTPLPEAFRHYRQELGAQVYGSMGIARDDKAGRQTAVMRNYEFFKAPAVAIVCMHRDLGLADALGVGMYLQTLVLSLTARGLSTCVEVSLADYAGILHAELAIPDELTVLCGLAIGYADPDFAANHLHIGREPFHANVTILST